MKYTKIAMVAACGAIALAMTGCKYDDVDGAGAESFDGEAHSKSFR